MSKAHNDPKVASPKERRWKEVGTSLFCQCGECIVSFERSNEHIQETSRHIRYPSTRGQICPSIWTNVDKTIIRENLLNYMPPERWQHLVSSPEGKQELNKHYKLGYSLCVRLKFNINDQGFKSCLPGDEEIRGRCLNRHCNKRHDLTIAYREDLLLRWIEAVEEKQADK